MNTEDPYKTPETTIQSPRPQLSPQEQLELDAALKKIKTGWIVALVVTALTAIVGTIQNLGAYMIVDVVIYLVLALGVYFKSRIAAGLLLLFFVIAKILQIIETGAPTGIIVGLIIIYCFYQTFMGTLTYHRLNKIGTQR